MFFHALRFTLAPIIAAGLLFAGPAHASTGASTTGILTEKHGDRLDGTVTPSTYEVVSPSGTVHVAGAPNPDWVGRTVTITDDDKSRPGIQGDVKLAAAQARTAMAPSAGARTTLVVLVALSDLSQPLTQEETRTAVFTGPASASALFSEQSGGRSFLTGIQRADGDIVGPLSVGVSGSGCDEDAIAEAADSAAAANGFAPAGYQQIVYVLPHVPDCAWGGLGQLPGKRAWTNGYLDTRVIAHEIGHNRGNHHASSLRCTDAGGQPTALSGSCTTSEYGDPFDVMGLPARLMSSFHRAQNGDLTEDAIQRVTTGGTYSLSSADLGSGVRLLLVPRKSPGQPVSEWYALERRSPHDRFDTFAVADPVSTGVTVRLVGRLSGTEQTRLLDNVARDRHAARRTAAAWCVVLGPRARHQPPRGAGRERRRGRDAGSGRRRRAAVRRHAPRRDVCRAGGRELAAGHRRRAARALRAGAQRQHRRLNDRADLHRPGLGATDRQLPRRGGGRRRQPHGDRTDDRDDPRCRDQQRRRGKRGRGRHPRLPRPRSRSYPLAGPDDASHVARMARRAAIRGQERDAHDGSRRRATRRELEVGPPDHALRLPLPRDEADRDDPGLERHVAAPDHLHMADVRARPGGRRPLKRGVVQDAHGFGCACRHPAGTCSPSSARSCA
jgi:hypothetical protein